MDDPREECRKLVRLVHDKLWLEHRLGYREGPGLAWPVTGVRPPPRPAASGRHPAEAESVDDAVQEGVAAGTTGEVRPFALPKSGPGPPEHVPSRPQALPPPSSGAPGPPEATLRGALPVLQPEPGAFLDFQSGLSKAERLRLLDQVAQRCTRCELAAGRRTVVFGEGNPDAILMLIGEGPGHVEDHAGRPFVGPAGQLLDRIIQAIEMTREEVYIANVVKCRPPGDRTPKPIESRSCMPYLLAQIDIIRPRVIGLLGATAAQAMTGRTGGITRLRGHWYDFQGIPMMATYHPAYLLRYEPAKKDCWIDMQKVRDKVRELSGPSP
ncbi:MAG: uracil-DNA glycosylase [Planctomycetes bacterium]|nr:uracil-DNA glycosylase [Planctomycetota bacterium]